MSVICNTCDEVVTGECDYPFCQQSRPAAWRFTVALTLIAIAIASYLS